MIRLRIIASGRPTRGGDDVEIKAGASLQGLQIPMRNVLMIAENIWRSAGRPEGVTVTSGTDGAHSAGSLHYYGYAVDLRIRYFSPDVFSRVFSDLSSRLSDVDIHYRCILEDDHIHVEYRGAIDG